MVHYKLRNCKHCTGLFRPCRIDNYFCNRDCQYMHSLEAAKAMPWIKRKVERARVKDLGGLSIDGRHGVCYIKRHGEKVRILPEEILDVQLKLEAILNNWKEKQDE